MALYLSTVYLSQVTSLPPDPEIGGGILVRPEVIVIPVAVAFGLPAILGTGAGVLAHNVLFRLVPGGVTPAFALLQTGVVIVAILLALLVRDRTPRPLNNLAATAALSVLLILPLGAFAAFEYGTALTEEWGHIVREVLLPINVLGFLLLEVETLLRPSGPRGSLEAGG